MQSTSRDTRQQLGCGYLPAEGDVHAWAPPLASKGFKHALPVICAGYTTRLPEVNEIVRAHAWWAKGQLEVYCGKEPPSELLKLGIEILDGEIARQHVYAITDKKHGGGRE
jgi:hypothetical protein